MPNWTQNELTLRGDPAVLQRVLDECCNDARDELDFRKIVPYPEGFDPKLTSGSQDEAYELYYNPDATRAFFGNSMFAERIAKHGSIEALRAHEEARYLETAAAALERSKLPGASQYDVEHAAEYEKYPTYKDLADAYKRNIEVGGTKTWYDWNCNHWGTKWNACEGRLQGTPDEGELVFNFDTAWSEPLPIFEALHEKYPTLEMKYVAEHEGDDGITGKRWFPEEEDES